MSRVCLQFVIVVFPDHTHLLFLVQCKTEMLLYTIVVAAELPLFLVTVQRIFKSYLVLDSIDRNKNRRKYAKKLRKSQKTMESKQLLFFIYF